MKLLILNIANWMISSSTMQLGSRAGGVFGFCHLSFPRHYLTCQLAGLGTIVSSFFIHEFQKNLSRC